MKNKILLVLALMLISSTGNAAYNTNINLATQTTGVLPVSGGGTGLNSLGSAYQVLTVNNAATNPVWANTSIYQGYRLVTVTTDTLLSSDGGLLVDFNTGTAGTQTVPSANTAGFGVGYGVAMHNRGVGTWTITFTTGQADGSTTLTLTTGEDCTIVSTGSGYIVTNCSGTLS